MYVPACVRMTVCRMTRFVFRCGHFQRQQWVYHVTASWVPDHILRSTHYDIRIRGGAFPGFFISAARGHTREVTHFFYDITIHAPSQNCSTVSYASPTKYVESPFLKEIQSHTRFILGQSGIVTCTHRGGNIRIVSCLYKSLKGPYIPAQSDSTQDNTPPGVSYLIARKTTHPLG